MSTIFGNGFTMMGHNEEHVNVTNKGTDLKVHSVTVEGISKEDSSKISALENKINSLLAINNNLQSQMAVLQNTVEHLTKSAPPLQSHTHNSPTNTMRTDCKDTKFSSTFQNDYNDVFLMDRNKLLELVRFRFREKNNFNETEKKEEFEDKEKDSEVEEIHDDDSNEVEEVQNPDDDDKENSDEEENVEKEKKDLENENKYSVLSIQYFLQWCNPFSRN